MTNLVDPDFKTNGFLRTMVEFTSPEDLYHLIGDGILPNMWTNDFFMVGNCVCVRLTNKEVEKTKATKGVKRVQLVTFSIL